MKELKREVLRGLEEELQKRISTFDMKLEGIRASAAKVRKSDPEQSADDEGERDEEERAERYRSGLDGPVLRELQERVDEGEFTWRQVRSGEAGRSVTDAYYDALRNTQAALAVRRTIDEAVSSGLGLDDLIGQHQRADSCMDQAAEARWCQNELRFDIRRDEDDELEPQLSFQRVAQQPVSLVDEDEDIAERDWFRRD